MEYILEDFLDQIWRRFKQQMWKFVQGLGAKGGAKSVLSSLFCYGIGKLIRNNHIHHVQLRQVCDTMSPS